MKRHARTALFPPAFSLMWRLAGLGAGLAATAALAQTPPSLPPTPPAASPQPYVDRVMEGLPPLEDGLVLKASEYNEAGWPRSWRVDYSLFSQ
ncbi:MAG: hypothetical protein ACREBY_16195, partial [Polaromonas sp.]